MHEATEPIVWYACMQPDTVASSASVRFVMTGCTMCVLLASVRLAASE